MREVAGGHLIQGFWFGEALYARAGAHVLDLMRDEVVQDVDRLQMGYHDLKWARDDVQHVVLDN